MDAPVTIRSGREADLAILGQALAEIQNFELDIVGYPLKPAQDVWEDYLSGLLARLGSDDGVFLVAEAGAKVIGIIAGYIEEAGDLLVASEFDRSAYISDLLVQREWRRRGVATALLREFERTMLAKGLQWMTVCVKSKNMLAQSAYEKYGFEPYETTLVKEIS